MRRRLGDAALVLALLVLAGIAVAQLIGKAVSHGACG
jgi:hypothetical protein